MRGGIAEKGGVRVGHRIIEINSKLLQLTQTVWTMSKRTRDRTVPYLHPKLTLIHPRLNPNFTLTKTNYYP